MKTIYILWLREIKRYLRSKSRIIGSLGQPLLFLLALGYGLGSVFAKAGEGNYFDFLAPGIIGMSIIFTAIFSGIQIIWDRQFGFLKETLVAPVNRLNIMIGRTLGGATVATMQGLFVLVLVIIFGFRPYNWGLVLVAILFMLLVALLFAALGAMIGSLLDDMQGFQLIMNFLVMPLFFLSGALFPIDGLPAILDGIVKFDPLSYGIDSFRILLVNSGSFGLGLDFTVLVIVAAAFLGLGSYFFSKIQV
ncbi:MAG TPA: ABC transporter permease [Candidatus Paceibacterota bacterium]|nr:ABC transporter permease [Candidatus Paceibacterota bacterium]